MNKLTEQIIALSGVFTSAALVNDLAENDRYNEHMVRCLIKSLTVINPATTLEVFAGDIHPLKYGIKHLQQAMLKQDFNPLVMRYSLALIKLQSLLANRDDLLNKIAAKLPYIENQCENFDALHDNVIDACSDTYRQSVGSLQQKIYIMGKKEYLDKNSSMIRALLLTGIRSAMLWKQLGGSRWQLLFKRGKILQEINTLLA